MIFVSVEKWRKKAACADIPRTAFFPRGRSSTKEALAACARCEVVNECLKYALDNQISFGIWGGKTEAQRKKMVA